jgi:hypothetical protein
MSNERLNSISIEKNAEESDILPLIEKLDFLDIQILRKFYMTGKEFPSDSQPYCFPILFQEMKANHQLKIGMEALRKRLNNLVRMGLLEKVKKSNPTNYVPIKEKEKQVKIIIMKFFVIHGLSKFL